MPVPFFANTGEDREVLKAQRAVKEVFDLANNADLKLVGLGTVDAEAQLVLSGMVEPGEIDDIAAAGGVGEILDIFRRRRPHPRHRADGAHALCVFP